MTTKAQVLQAIRKHCLECMGGSWVDVRDCTSVLMPNGKRRCSLHPFRFGKDPNPAKGGKFHGKRVEQVEDERTDGDD